MGSLAVTAAMLSLSQVREAFGVGIPSAEDIEIVVAMALAITLLSESVKTVLRRMEAPPKRSPARAKPG